MVPSRHRIREQFLTTNLVDPVDDAAIQAFRIAQEAAVLEVADQGLLTLASLVANGAIDVSPKFQRRDRWNAERQSLLIESFLCNIPVPPVYLAEDSALLGSYAVIDGKQRLTSVSSFFADRLVLRGLTRLSGLNGKKYSSLPAPIKNALGMKALRTTTLLRQSDQDLKHEVFLRLNTGGEVLNPQEIRNVAYRGPLNELIYDLAENPFLRRQLKVTPPSSPAYRQMTDAEFVLRFLTLSSTWREFRGDLRGSMDEFMASERFADGPMLSMFEKAFQGCMTTAEAIWGDQAFKRPGRDQVLAGLYDAQMVGLFERFTAHSTLIARRDTVRDLSNALFDDPEFDEAVRRATNTPARLVTRIEMMHSALERAATPGGKP
jgi:hypothetical protein